ncbi:hypothetical protein C5167_018474, partial [Papaver somniferum]
MDKQLASGAVPAERSERQRPPIPKAAPWLVFPHGKGGGEELEFRRHMEDWVESGNDIFKIVLNCSPRGYRKVASTHIFKLDFSSMTWVLLKSLGDHVLFLCTNMDALGLTSRKCYSTSSAYCSAADMGLDRGCLFYTLPEDQTLYTFEPEDNATTVIMPCLKLPTPWFLPTWVMMPTTVNKQVAGRRRSITDLLYMHCGPLTKEGLKEEHWLCFEHPISTPSGRNNNCKQDREGIDKLLIDGGGDASLQHLFSRLATCLFSGLHRRCGLSHVLSSGVIGGGGGHGGKGGDGYSDGTFADVGVAYGKADLPCELGIGSGNARFNLSTSGCGNSYGFTVAFIVQVRLFMARPEQTANVLARITETKIMGMQAVQKSVGGHVSCDGGGSGGGGR